MAKKVYGAIDLGATSGRVMKVTFDGNQLEMEPMHRFPTRVANLFGVNYCMYLDVFDNICTGLRKLGNCSKSVSSVALSSCGGTAFIDKYGELIGCPINARNHLFVSDIIDEVFAIVPKKRFYMESGCQHLNSNAQFLLYYYAKYRPELLAQAEFAPGYSDLFGYWLSGEQYNEYTLSTITQLVRADRKGWCEDILEELGVPSKIFRFPIQPGEVSYPLHPSMQKELRLPGTKLCVGAQHDTAAAAAALPSLEEDYLYASCGTWTILGTDTRQTIVNDTTWKYNISNEGGVFGLNQLLINVLGMFPLEDLRREWEKEGKDVSFEYLLPAAESAPALVRFIDPDEPRFNLFGNMSQKINDFLVETGQTPCETDGEFIRCLLESLAMKYRYSIEMLFAVSGKRLSKLHVLGGASRNALLNQFIADACNMVVVAGPQEATTIGSVLVQIACEENIKDLRALREISIRSSTLKEFEPKEPQKWEDAYERFQTYIYMGKYNFED